VTLNDAREAHATALTFGGLAGERDLGLVQSAIARPYSGYYRTVAGKAAALVQSLALNHGFVDGNKRTALIVANLFVDRSGYHLVAFEGDLNREFETVILDVVEHRIGFDVLVRWFQQRLRGM
jgi:death-on-curing protein